jgi:phosphatidylglycerophosphate synthase
MRQAECLSVGRQVPWMGAPGVFALLPNALSLTRLLLGVVFPWLPPSWRLAAVVAAGLTDLLDGAFSRLLHAQSRVGRLLDPVADKVFLAGVVLTLLVEGTLGLGEAVLLGLRDLAVLFLAVAVLSAGHRDALGRASPTLLGKATTAAQFGFLLVLFAAPGYHGFALVPTAALSALAGAQYLSRHLR